MPLQEGRNIGRPNANTGPVLFMANIFDDNQNLSMSHPLNVR